MKWLWMSPDSRIASEQTRMIVSRAKNVVCEIRLVAKQAVAVYFCFLIVSNKDGIKP